MSVAGERDPTVYRDAASSHDIAAKRSADVEHNIAVARAAIVALRREALLYRGRARGRC